MGSFQAVVFIMIDRTVRGHESDCQVNFQFRMG